MAEEATEEVEEEDSEEEKAEVEKAVVMGESVDSASHLR